MTEKIDRGEILYQEKILVTNTDSLFSLYQKAYSVSIHATVKAIEGLKKKSSMKISQKLPTSYFSFPNTDSWRNFFKKGYHFI